MTAMYNTWRYECPEGHRGVELGTGKAYCDSCYQLEQYDQYTYCRGEITDLVEVG